ncbi:MAG TPA: SRPBCC family protein [Actinomycetota bacterium]|nr:SRPBCC family protein [Actinomycetota bacterium]
MIEVEAQVVLPVPPAEAFRVLARWGDQPRWMRDADRVQVLEGPGEGVGTRLAVRTRVLGLAALTDVLEVVAWDPPRRIAVAHRGPVRGLGEWDLCPVAAGTRFVWRERLELPVPLVGPLALRAYRPLMRRLMRRSLAGLRRFVERAMQERGGPPAADVARDDPSGRRTT